MDRYTYTYIKQIENDFSYNSIVSRIFHYQIFSVYVSFDWTH